MPLLSRRTDERRQRRSLAVRVEQLPLATRTAVKALELYLASTTAADEEGLLRALDGVVTRFERSYSDGTSIAEVVGGDVVAFAESVGQTCGRGAWLAEQQARLVEAFEQAEREQGPQ